MRRTVCFMVLLRTVLNQYLVEVGCCRQCDARGSVAEGNCAGLLRITSMLLVRLNGDAVCTQGCWIVFVIQTFPFQYILSGGPGGSCDGLELFLVPRQKAPCSRKVRIIFRVVAPKRQHTNELAKKVFYPDRRVRTFFGTARLERKTNREVITSRPICARRHLDWQSPFQKRKTRSPFRDSGFDSKRLCVRCGLDKLKAIVCFGQA